MTMWMVRAGRDSVLFQSFIDQGLVAIGWDKAGDLTAFQTRDEILAKVREQWPNSKQTVQAGILYRFSKEMEIGEHVITYDQTRRIYAVGEISGDYRFETTFDTHLTGSAPFANIRTIQWRETRISRDNLSSTTRNTLGSALTVFRLSNDAEQDVLRALEGRPMPPGAGISEDKVENEDLLEDIEARSIEFIKDYVVGLSWEDMQELVAGLLRAMGYKTRVSAAGPDRGKDIVASPDGFGFENPRIVVEVKHRPDSTMGSQEVRSFLGGRHPNDKGLYVSTGGFSKEAHYEAERANIPVTLVGLDELVAVLMDNYERLDTQTRTLVPLKRIYWPMS